MGKPKGSSKQKKKFPSHTNNRIEKSKKPGVHKNKNKKNVKVYKKFVKTDENTKNGDDPLKKVKQTKRSFQKKKDDSEDEGFEIANENITIKEVYRINALLHIFICT